MASRILCSVSGTYYARNLLAYPVHFVGILGSDSPLQKTIREPRRVQAQQPPVSAMCLYIDSASRQTAERYDVGHMRRDVVKDGVCVATLVRRPMLKLLSRVPACRDIYRSSGASG